MTDATLPVIAPTIPALLFSAARHHAARTALEEPGRCLEGAQTPQRRQFPHVSA